MEFFPQQDPSIVTKTAELLDILVKLLTALAIIGGGIWTYFHYFRGRLYYARLELGVDLELRSKGTSYYILVISHVKNVGLSRVDLDRDASGVTLDEYDENRVIDGIRTAESVEIGVFDIFENHKWVEPNESISDLRLVMAPRLSQVAFRAAVRVVGSRHAWLGEASSFEWNTGRIVFTDVVSSNDIGTHLKQKTGDQDDTVK